MVFLCAVGRCRGRNAFCTHSMNAANLRDAAYGAANSARSPGIPERSWAPRGGGVSLTSLHSGVPHCTILACVRHVDDPTGRARRGKKDLAGGQSSRGGYRCCYLHYVHVWKNKEQEAANSQELSVRRAQPIRGLEQAGYHSGTRSISVLTRALPAACASKLEEEGRQDPSTYHCSQTSAGDQRRQRRLRLSLDAPDGDRLMASALIPAFELQMRGAGPPVVSCDAPLVRAAYCSL